MDPRIITTQCPHCHHTRPWATADRLIWLQRSGFLRKHKDPADDIVAEMFRLKLSELPCPQCQRPGGRIVTQVQSIEEDDDQWETAGSANESAVARYCEDCREPIDPDRVELFPETKRCVECQRQFESGSGSGSQGMVSADDLCPKCGDFLQTQRNRSSRIAYRVQCGSCGYSPKR